MSDLLDEKRTDEAVPLPVSGGEAVAAEPEDQRKKKRLILLGLLGLLLLTVVLIDIFYLVSRKPLTELVPPAATVAKALPPTYVTSIYGVNAPVGVAASQDSQRLYVGESDGDRLIRAFDRTGKELYSFYPQGSSPGSRAPVYMAVDANGQLYVADRLRQRVSAYGTDGRFLSDLTPPAEAALKAPLGVSFDSKGNLYVTDATKDDHKVVMLDKAGNLVRRVGKYGGGDGEFLFPNQAVADSRGRMYVTNGNAGRIDIFAADGSFVGPLAAGSAKGSVGLPRGIAVDAQDRLFVVDSVGCTVQVFDVAGDKPAYLYNFGSEGSDDGQLLYPTGIAVDSTGRIYLADTINYRVEVWTY